MADVESIIERIDEGEIGLADSLDAWERGMSLLTHCRAMLDRAEQRVEEIKIEAASGKGRPKSGSSAAMDDADIDQGDFDVPGEGDPPFEPVDEEDIPF